MSGLSQDVRSESRSPLRKPTFLTNHAAVLIMVAVNPNSTVLEISRSLGLRERLVASLIADLRRADILDAERAGRRNRYEIHRDVPLSLPFAAGATVGDLLALFLPDQDGTAESA